MKTLSDLRLRIDALIQNKEYDPEMPIEEALRQLGAPIANTETAEQETPDGSH